MGRAAPWLERFWAKVDKRGAEECWPWLGAVAKKTGYGVFGRSQGDIQYAHRIAVVIATGAEIPKGMTVDHVRSRGCTRRDCVNPHHLELVTLGENVKRGGNKQKTHCPLGHALAEHGCVRGNGWRYCRLCAVRQRKALRLVERELSRG